ncbi:MAG: hypothetical protein Kilf2KO_02170 [Rhodospirillales bacterium]
MVHRGEPEGDRQAASPPLVSLIVPLYDAGTFLADTLASVKDQTYKTIEVVIVDDGSRDDSLEIAERFRDDFTKFTLTSQENRGVAAARNRGLDLASGDFIGFLDADDLLVPDSVARRVALLRAGDHRLCGGVTEIVDDSGKSLNLRVGRQNTGDYRHIWQVPCQISTLMGHADIMRSQRFIEGKRFAEDWVYIVDLLQDGWTIGSCGNRPLSKYRWHATSATGKQIYDHFENCVALLHDLGRDNPALVTAKGSDSRERFFIAQSRLKRAVVERTQAAFSFYLLRGDEDPVIESRLIAQMNAISKNFERFIKGSHFETTAVRALLLPKGSDALHGALCEKAPKALVACERLQPTTANQAFVKSLRLYLSEVVDKAEARGLMQGQMAPEDRKRLFYSHHRRSLEKALRPLRKILRKAIARLRKAGR